MKYKEVILFAALFNSILSTEDFSEERNELEPDSDAMGHMMKLYNQLMLHPPSTEGGSTTRENTYSFEGKGKRLAGAANVATFSFDISALNDNEEVLRADLRMTFTMGCRPYRVIDEEFDDGFDGEANCRLEGLLHDHCETHGASVADVAQWTRFHRLFPIAANKVLSFEITDMVRVWHQQQHGKQHRATGCVAIMLTYQGGSQSQRRRLITGLLGSLTSRTHRPAIVVHTQDNSPEIVDVDSFLPSDIETLMAAHSIGKRQVVVRNPRQQKGCSRVKHYVNFKSIGLSNRIIAPRGINMNYCSGRCTFPLSTNRNRTVHAEIQALLHLLDNQTVPKVCCSPMKYTPTVLLFYTKNKTLTLKVFNKISVSQCGCS